MESYFNVYKEYLQSGYLQEDNVNPNDVLDIITVEENITEEENMLVSYIRNYAFVFIIMGGIFFIIFAQIVRILMIKYKKSFKEEMKVVSKKE